MLEAMIDMNSLKNSNDMKSNVIALFLDHKIFEVVSEIRNNPNEHNTMICLAWFARATLFVNSQASSTIT